MYQLKESTPKFAASFIDYLDYIAKVKKGDCTMPQDWQFDLKIAMATYDEDNEEISSVDQMAVISIYQNASGLIFADFEFPELLTRHEQEEHIYEKYATGYDSAQKPVWVDQVFQDDAEADEEEEDPEDKFEDFMLQMIAQLQQNSSIGDDVR